MRYFFLGAPIVEPAFLGSKTRFAHLGNNTGNLLIGRSLFDELDVTYHDGGAHSDPQWINENFDYIAIPSANFLFHSFDMSYLATVVEQTKLPCLVVGLGAQAPTDSSLDLKLQPGTLRFLKVIAERSVEIGVRGSFTADALEHLGIKNVCITGCPSLFRSRKPTVKIHKVDRRGISLRVAVNGSRDIMGHAASVTDAVRVQRQLLELAIRDGHYYVLQSEMPEIALHCSRLPIERETEIQIAAIIRRLELSVSIKDYITFVRRQCRVFFDLHSWDRFIETVHLSIGSRFHGNLIALTNGLPAIVITHDARTQELADLIHVPRYRNAELSTVDIENLYDQADYSAFEKQYAFLYRNFKEFLSHNKVAHRLT